MSTHAFACNARSSKIQRTEEGSSRLRWREPDGDSKLGWCELGGSRLGWKELVGSRLRSANMHDAALGGQTHATTGFKELMELGGSRLRQRTLGSSRLRRREHGD